ncbi:hypothetical protein GCM10009415_11550 [Chitinophaga japonensis]
MRYLQWYALVCSLLVIVLLLSAFRKSGEQGIVKSLRAEKIEIVEADGTVKLSLFNKKHLPPAVIDGHKLPRQGGGESGLMFYNEEGEECGGLIYDGAKGDNGASITFDQYKQDQVVQLLHSQRSGMKGLIINDRPEKSIALTFSKVEEIRRSGKDSAAQQQAISELAAQGYFGHRRMMVGQTGRSTGMFVYDSLGNKRLEMMVNEKNMPVIVFYNEKGNEVKRISY